MAASALVGILMELTSFAAVAIALTLAPTRAMAASVQCMVRATRCIKSQGTEISSKQVIEVLERCDYFIKDDIGRIALKLSAKEVLDRTGGKLTRCQLDKVKPTNERMRGGS